MLCFLSRRPLSASATSVCVIPHKGEYFVPKHLRYVHTYALYLHLYLVLYIHSPHFISFSLYLYLFLYLYCFHSTALYPTLHQSAASHHFFLPLPLSSPLPPFWSHSLILSFSIPPSPSPSLSPSVSPSVSPSLSPSLFLRHRLHLYLHPFSLKIILSFFPSTISFNFFCFFTPFPFALYFVSILFH